jgi:hypothetical protein
MVLMGSWAMGLWAMENLCRVVEGGVIAMGRVLEYRHWYDRLNCSVAGGNNSLSRDLDIMF